MGKGLYISYILLTCSLLLRATEVPKVYHFTEQDYRAHSQNWGIAQTADHRMFFGNSDGLLLFDGANWQTAPTPFSQVIRTVQTDENDRIFVGGFATLGYFETNKKGIPEYVSLLHLMDDEQLFDDEIWHILPIKGAMLFQSFSTIYKYDYEKITVVQPPGNILFCRELHGKVIVPVIEKGLYEYKPDGSFSWIKGSEIFAGKQVASILPNEDGWFVCLKNGGVFVNRYDKWHPWQTPVNDYLKTFQLNKGIRLTNGNYAFGTILSGLFITDEKGKVLHHINQENGLQNNTVLSIYEDKMNMLWAGLDKGIDLIDLPSPLVFFQDKTGHIGTVYSATVFEGSLYVGTNQGVFSKKFPADKDGFKLIEGSQGQVWDLKVFDGQLVAGHNSGSALIHNGQMEVLFNSTGVYTNILHPFMPDVMLQGTYTGIIVLRKNEKGLWKMSDGLRHFFQSSKKLAFDLEGRLWVLHPRKGLFRVTLNENLEEAILTESFGHKQGFPSEFKLDMAKIGDEIIFQSDSLFFTWDERTSYFVPKNMIGQNTLEPGKYSLVTGNGHDWFKVYPSTVQYYHGTSDQLRISMTSGDGQIVGLPDSSYLFCMDDGYAILRMDKKMEGHKKVPPPLITGVFIRNKQAHLVDVGNLPQPTAFKPSENQLKFSFSTPNFTFRPAMRFRLVGFDEEWSAFQTVNTKEFTNLPPSDYQFQVQSELSPDTVSFHFTVEPKWYETVWAKAIWLLLFLAILWLLLQWHDRRMRTQKQHLQLEKEKELEQQRIQANNELLQAEILNKSRILADTTMNLIRKNEMLTKIKEELDQATHKRNTEPPAKSLSKMEHLINAHLTSEEDWQVFEANFNQLHDQFFKRLKEQYPDLTPGDLRLAAYLKMNLSSKEIAPLLNISIRGVENKRYRLRHKMGLEGEVNLTEYLMGY